MAVSTRRPCGPHRPQTPFSGCDRKSASRNPEGHRCHVCGPPLRGRRKGRLHVSRVEERPTPRQQGLFCSVFVCGLCQVFTALHGLSCPAARGIPGLQLIVEVWGGHTAPPQTHLPSWASPRSPTVGSALRRRRLLTEHACLGAFVLWCSARQVCFPKERMKTSKA